VNPTRQRLVIIPVSDRVYTSSAGSTSPSATARRWPAVASRAAPGAPRGRALPDRRDATRAPAWTRRRAGPEAPEKHQPTGTRPHRATRTGTPTSRNWPAGYRSARGIRSDTEEIAFADCAISPSLALAHPTTTQTLCSCDATNVRRRCEASRCCLAHVPHQSPDAPPGRDDTAVRAICSATREPAAITRQAFLLVRRGAGGRDRTDDLPLTRRLLYH
jgi:hypothetical protein